jgi:hypothetical protein
VLLFTIKYDDVKLNNFKLKIKRFHLIRLFFKINLILIFQNKIQSIHNEYKIHFYKYFEKNQFNHKNTY